MVDWNEARVQQGGEAHLNEWDEKGRRILGRLGKMAVDGCKGIWKEAGRLSMASARVKEIQEAKELVRRQRAEAEERKRKTQVAKDAAFMSSAFFDPVY